MKNRTPWRELMRRKYEYLDAIKAERGCETCGENDPIVLEFDHIDPDTKHEKLRYKKGVSLPQLSWPNLTKEVMKCRVLCANCHRRATAVQRWSRLKEE